jgi:hypothetical protein
LQGSLSLFPTAEKEVIVFRGYWLYTEFKYRFVTKSEAAAEIYSHEESGNRR